MLGDIVDFTRAGTVKSEITIMNIYSLTSTLSAHFTKSLSACDLELALVEGLKFVVPRNLRSGYC